MRKHAVPSGLKMVAETNRRLTPVATSCRPAGTKVSVIKPAVPTLMFCYQAWLTKKAHATFKSHGL